MIGVLEDGDILGLVGGMRRALDWRGTACVRGVGGGAEGLHRLCFFLDGLASSRLLCCCAGFGRAGFGVAVEGGNLSVFGQFALVVVEVVFNHELEFVFLGFCVSSFGA